MTNIKKRMQGIDSRRLLREDKKKHINAAQTAKEMVVILRFLF
jgi:hypothetical protein